MAEIRIWGFALLISGGGDKLTKESGGFVGMRKGR